MKNLSLFLLSAILLTSCYSELPDYSSMKKSTMSGTNAQLDSIKADIQMKRKSLSFDQKLEICLFEYSLQYQDIYQDMIDNQPDDVKAVLLKDEGFIRICKSMGIDPNNIPEDYFSPYK